MEYSKIDQTYIDDALRIMRNIRLCNKYDFTFSKPTWDAMVKNSYRLSIISKERIVDEMQKSLLSAKRPYRVFMNWMETGLMKYISPEIIPDKLVDKIFYSGRTYKFISHMSEYIGKEVTFEMYLAAIYKTHPKALKNLKLSNESLNKTLKYIESLEYIGGDIYLPSLRKFGVKYGSLYKDCVKLIHCYVLSQYVDDMHLEWIKLFEHNIAALEKSNTMFDDTTVLPVDGFDIMKWFELKPSAKVKELMNKAWEFYYVNPRLTKKDLEKMLRDCIM